MKHAYFDGPRPRVLGHRGAAGCAPENTLASFALALERGAQILESDVHVTRDGVPVLIHDPSVDRTTEGRGPVAELDWADLAKLDAGYRFVGEDDARPSHRGQGLRIPSLEEAFATFPGARFNLEIKAPGRTLAERCIDLVERFDRADRTLLTAGEDDVMADLRAALAASGSRPATGACLGEIVQAVKAAAGEGGPPPQGVMALQIPDSFGGAPLVTPALLEYAHAHEIEVHVWTINDLAEIAALVELGVDGIVTDHPGRMAAWLR